VGEPRATVADVPGLVEGAHEGRGLGHRFLRHVTRCRALVLVVDLSSGDPPGDLGIVLRELELFDPKLADRPSIVVGTKADLVEDADRRAQAMARDALAVSAIDGTGVVALADRLETLVRDATASSDVPRRGDVVLRPARPAFTVRREGERFVVTGRNVERWVTETDMDDARRVVELQRRLVRAGVERRLAELGARRGDEVAIAGQVFEFIPEDAGGGRGGS
jgi:GTP-binding protein